ncbi:hypothetical protein AMTR_s00309p00015550, partial [Amborella trichopoda]
LVGENSGVQSLWVWEEFPEIAGKCFDALLKPARDIFIYADVLLLISGSGFTRVLPSIIEGKLMTWLLYLLRKEWDCALYACDPLTRTFAYHLFDTPLPTPSSPPTPNPSLNYLFFLFSSMHSSR